jgi:acetate kinase
MRILTINTGSSSLKLGLYKVDNTEHREISAEIQRIASSEAQFTIKDQNESILVDETRNVRDHADALQLFFQWLRKHGEEMEPEAIGHRVVHGGSAHSEPERITSELLADLRKLVAIDPDHLPQALATIDLTSRVFPHLPQVACFDTTFHRHMPRIARLYALPRELWDTGIVRYGFHGLSYEYIMSELRRIEPRAAEGRVVIAHLGNGASMAAVHGGTSVETTMGFTPMGGLVMGTRPGDLDPGVLLYLLQERGMSPSNLNWLLNHQSGLIGVSKTSSDMRDLLARESNDQRAAEAIALFCYTARKFLGALAAVLGGLDTLIFTGGIGENAAPVRERICTGLEFLGIEIDPQRNAQHTPIISSDASRVTIRVMKTDEDVMIARHTYQRILGGIADELSV